jgi:uncharacterized membrane protein YkvA (DUF1232 family)
LDAEIEQRFVDTMRSWLIALPHDLKILYEAAADENLPRELRELSVGAVIYTVSPTDFISSDREDFAGYADDCIMLRLTLRQIAKRKDEDCEYFAGRFSDFFATLEDELQVCRTAMGELFTWLEAKVDALTSLEYKGKKIPAYLDEEVDRELLYEDGLGFATEYPVLEDDIGDKFKRAASVLEVIQRRKDEEDRK